MTSLQSLRHDDVIIILSIDVSLFLYDSKKAVSVTASLATEFYAPRDQQYAPTGN